MKIAHTADWHLTEGNRFEEKLKALEFIISTGADEGVALWIVGGDLAGTTVPHRQTPLERNTLASLFIRMSEFAPVIIPYGNHDYERDLDVFGKLRGNFPIHVVSRPETLCVALPSLPAECGYHVVAHVLPYPQKKFLAMGGTESVEAGKGQYESMLRTLLLAWQDRAESYREYPHIFVGHLNIGGSKVAGDEIMIGQEIELSPSDLDALAVDYVALGHIHLHQQVGARGFYPGTPAPNSFGEESYTCGFIVADVQLGKPPEMQFIKTPVRKLVTVDVHWSVDQNDWMVGVQFVEATDHGAAKDAEVRLRVEIPEEASGVADPSTLIAALEGKAGAHSVKVERQIVPVERVRSVEIREAHTTEAKLEAYWQSLSESSRPAQGVRDRAKEKLVEIEQ